MAKATTTKAEMVRRQLSHPVVDADGHLVELLPVLDDEILTYLEEAGGTELADRYRASSVAPFDTNTVLADRQSPSVRRDWRAMPSWWGWPVVNTLDRATAHLPELLYERLDSFGIDFTILYPSTVARLARHGRRERGAGGRLGPRRQSVPGPSLRRLRGPYGGRGPHPHEQPGHGGGRPRLRRRRARVQVGGHLRLRPPQPRAETRRRSPALPARHLRHRQRL